MKTVAVIPAYNEEATIDTVAEMLVSHQLIEDVIVISDGSTDNTVKVAQDAGAQVIEQQENLGKGAAMQVGINTELAEKADIILFLDADLLGLTAEHINKLLQPIIAGKVEMTLGVFTKGRMQTDFGHKITPFLSGQRAVKRRVLDNISNLEATRFGVEMALTKYVKENDVEFKKVELRDLTHRMKEEKMGFWRGLIERIKMYWQVIKNFFQKSNKV